MIEIPQNLVAQGRQSGQQLAGDLGVTNDEFIGNRSNWIWDNKMNLNDPFLEHIRTKNRSNIIVRPDHPQIDRFLQDHPDIDYNRLHSPKGPYLLRPPSVVGQRPGEGDLLMAAAEMHNEGRFDQLAMEIPKDPSSPYRPGRVPGEAGGGGVPNTRILKGDVYGWDESTPGNRGFWSHNQNKPGGRAYTQEESDAMVKRLNDYLRRETLGIRSVPKEPK